MLKYIKKGFSLIEIMLTLSIIIIITTSVFFIYKKSDEDRKASAIINEISSIKNAADVYFRIEKSYSNISNAQLISTDMIPSNMIVGDGLLMGANGNMINITKSPVNLDLRYNILYKDVTPEYCIKIVSIVNPMLYAITVEGEIKHENEDRKVRYSVDKTVLRCKIKDKVSVMFQSLS